MQESRLAVPILMVFLVTFFAGSAQTGMSRVKIDTGTLQGSTHNGITSFKGIRSAAPPVIKNRWRSPQPAAHWKGVRDATKYGFDCMQLPFPSDAAPLGTPPSATLTILLVQLTGQTTSKQGLPIRPIRLRQ